MSIHALRESFLDARPLDLGIEAPDRATAGPQKSDASFGAQPQNLGILIAAGLGALALLASMMFGYTPLHNETAAAFLSIAAISLLAALGAVQRACSKAATLERTLASRDAALDGAGGVVLRWDLLSGSLAWEGNAADLLPLASNRLPANIRDLRLILHPDDSLYALAAKALKMSERCVSWNVRIKEGEDGWRPFLLRGAIKGAGSGRPSFLGVLIPAGAPSEPGAEIGGRLTGILESLPISIAIWDSRDKLLLCNRKFRQLYGVGRAAVALGASFAEAQAQARETIEQGPPEKRGPAGRYTIREKQLADGSWLQIGEYWTRDGSLVSFGNDVTMAKLNERQVLERERQMRARVDGFEESRRQLEIQARQLRELAESYNEEKIRAEAANQAKSEFLANVSHELRTPLNAIIGFSEMMRDGVLGPIGNPKYEAYVRDINASGRYLLEMINDILDMSKIEAGRMTLAPQWVELSSIFEECLSVVYPGALEGKVDIIQAGGSNVSVFGDKRALKQVLINLLSNAVKFTPSGGKVVLRAYRYRGSVRISIADTGVGIAKHDLGRLGKPFEQVGNQLTKGHKGTGLGLAISRSLIEMHGGKLDIKSRIGEGTTVTCILPMQDDKGAGSREAA
jgi:two-component system, cell cycle sensor histidine kinase PleC